MYTSGSTGRPKCALWTQKGLANVAWGWARRYEMHDGARVAHNAGLCFDANLAVELWPCLVGGAALYPLTDPEVRLWAGMFTWRNIFYVQKSSVTFKKVRDQRENPVY